MKKQAIRSAFLDTVPVMTGYLFLGFGFGIVLHQIGYGVLWAGAMSLFIYAGSMQYMAVSLLTSGAGLLTTALTTFVVNARHLFYGISMSSQIQCKYCQVFFSESLCHSVESASVLAYPMNYTNYFIGVLQVP